MTLKRTFLGISIIGGLLIASVALASIVTGNSNTSLSEDVAYTVVKTNKPSGTVVRDLLLVSIAVNGGTSANITAPNGWTLISRADNDLNVSIVSYWKVADASEPASYTWIISPQTRATGGITRFGGVDSITPIDTVATSSGRGTTATAPAVTTSFNNGRIITLFATNIGTSNSSLFATSTGMTKRYDIKNMPFGPTSSAQDKLQVDTGSTGIFSSLFNSAPREWVAQTLVLRPVNLQDDIIAYWKMDGSSSDATGSGHNGSDTGITYSSSNGVINNGAGFSPGSNSKITITDTSALKPMGDFTVNFWLKTSAVNNPAFFSSYSQNTNAAGIRFNLDSGKILFLSGRNTGLTKGTDYEYIQSASSPNDGNWHMWTGVYNGSQLLLYKDGNSTPDASISWAYSPGYAASNYIRIGQASFDGTDIADTLNGSIDDVGFWGRALSTSEIANLYNSGSGLQYPF